MVSGRKLLESFAVNILLKVAAMILGLYQLFWITGQTSVEQLATYNISAAYLFTIVMFTGFGIYAILQKELTNSRDTEYSGRLWTTFFWLRIVTVVLGLGVSLIIPTIDSNIPTILIALMFVQSAITLIDYNYFAVYAAKADVWKYSLTDLCGKIPAALALFAYTQGFQPISNPVLYFVITQILGGVITLGVDYLWNRGRVVWGRFDFDLLKKLFPNLLLIAISWLIIGFYQNNQAVYLNRFGVSDQQLNGFVQAFLVVQQAMLAVGVINTQIASSIKKAADSTPSTSLKLTNFWKYMSVYTGVLILTYIALVLLGPLLLKVVDSQAKYLGSSIALLPILGLYLIPNCLSGMLTYLNVFYHQEKLQLGAVFIQLILTVVGMFVFIPMYGIAGASWVVVVVAFIDVLFMRLPLALKMLRSNH